MGIDLELLAMMRVRICLMEHLWAPWRNLYVGHPQEAAILLAVELCSLTLQPDDLSVPNLVSSGLFGDGAAAVLMVGAEHPLAARGASVLDSRASSIDQVEAIERSSIDFYAATRSLYRQNRNAQIRGEAANQDLPNF